MAFVNGIELSRRLYAGSVRPLLAHRYPGLAYTAALVGTGSEVLGFDTERSTDHDWGSRLQLFLGPEDFAAHGTDVERVLVAGCPADAIVVVADLGDWLAGRLGFNPLGRITMLDWLATPTQALAEVTAGTVHHDGLGRLHPVRQALAWYPDDLWRYLLACQWERLSEEEPFVGRCGEVGDELGSAVVAGRLVRDLMRLWLLMGRTYPPYAKWLGSAFARLPGAGPLGATLRAVLAATGWREREEQLVVAYETVARRHNDLSLTLPVDPRVRLFFDRPFRVLRGERFSQPLIASIADPAVRALPLTGGIDQFVDSTAALTSRPDRRRRITAAMYSG